MRNKAFTLAEVLITLAIIGVIAAISVPSLIQKTNQAELITAWKKQFATISQAYDQMLFDNGSEKVCTSDFNNGCLRNSFSNYLKVIKKCDKAVTDGCFASGSKYLNGTDTQVGSVGINDTYMDSWPAVVLSNGASILFRHHYSDCHYDAGAGVIPPAQCGWMYIDVNGHKKPNVVGKDIYNAGIMSEGIVPKGGTGDNVDPATDCTATGTGLACSASALYSK